MSNEMQHNNSKALTPVERLKQVIALPSVQEQFQNALAENAPLFTASLIDVYASDSKLQRCEPRLVIMEALKAATLDLPINRQLGFAYIIPYDKSEKLPDGTWKKTPIPQFQPGYRAFIQLAMRTGQYRFINADMVYEGEHPVSNRITGELTISGTAKSETVIGYFAYFHTVNGFEKASYWTKDKVIAHAKRHSKTYGKEGKSNVWETDFDAMALKTVLKNLLSKYGILSVKMTKALVADTDDEAEAQDRIDLNANQGDVIDIDPEPIPESNPINGAAQTADGTHNAEPTQGPEAAEPGF